MKIKANIREVQSEKNPNFRGYATLTIGDMVIKDVAVSNVPSKTKEGETFIGFSLPQRTYQVKNEETGVEETKYSPIVEIKSEKEEDTKKLVSSIRKTLSETFSQEPNEYGFKEKENEVDIPYDPSKVTAYATPRTSEKNENLRAFANVYVGNVVRINDMAVTEGTAKDGTKFLSTNMPQRSYQDKEGVKKWEDQVFPTSKDLRVAINDKVKESYDYAMNRENEKTEEAKEPEGEEL